MLVGQPPMVKFLPAFHAFSEDTVLVAHNAAFDMPLPAAQGGKHWHPISRPVLDTLLLSAVIHPAQESHRLEAILRAHGEALSWPAFGPWGCHRDRRGPAHDPAAGRDEHPTLGRLGRLRRNLLRPRRVLRVCG
ncbi:MAG: hypothetical protein IPG40_13120 [Zoogloea sp.]|nr:hypothetical protein [Zoogloea sp.]